MKWFPLQRKLRPHSARIRTHEFSRPRSRCSSRHLRLEPLEERTVLSGIVTTSIGEGTSDRAFASFVTADDEIVVAGNSLGDFATLRYQAEGSLDQSFGTGGAVTTDIGRYSDYALAAVPVTDAQGAVQRIVVAGVAGTRNSGHDFGIACYTGDGSLDGSFGKKGEVQLDLGGSDYLTAVLVQPDGKIIAAGATDAGGTRNFVLVRFTESGQLDAGFGDNGVVETAIGSSTYSQINALAFHQDKILAVGTTENETDADFALVQYNLDGSLDDGGPLDSTPGDSFGTGGIVTNDFVGEDHANSVAIDGIGRIVVAGDVWVMGIRESFAVARYDSDGSLDTSFGDGGLVYNETPELARIIRR